MAKVSIEISGLPELLKKVQGMPASLQKVADAELLDSSFNVEAKAKTAAPANVGGLRQGISATKNAPLSYQVAVNVHYAPYVEFGTGVLVDVPAGLEAYAIQFKGKGIRQVNLPARPFLFPAVRLEAPELKKRLQEALKNL
jgi:HK97 gp10 family phage protein